MHTTSKNPGKQRKAQYNADLHQKRKSIAGHLSEDLKKKMKTRSVTLRVEDTVKVVRGGKAGTQAKITRVDTNKGVIFLDKLTRKKNDGKEIFIPIQPSNVVVMELNDKDPMRFSAGKKTQPTAKAPAKPVIKK